MDFEYAGAESVDSAHVIGRSWFGGLSICFDGGCSYPSMIGVLEAVFKRYGRLVRFGESLSAQDWIARVEESGFHISEQERSAVLTLMRAGISASSTSEAYVKSLARMSLALPVSDIGLE